MKRIVDVYLVLMSRRVTTWVMPVVLSMSVVLIMVVVAGAMRLAGLDTFSDPVASGMRNNQGIVWTLVGFLVALGVQSAVSCFAFSTALGTTRRHYVLGNALYFVFQTVYITAWLTLLLVLERATNHWFLGAYSLDVKALGLGDWGHFFSIVPVGVLASVALGAVAGASWLRFGSRGPLIIGGVMLGAVAVAIVLIVPRWESFIEWYSLGVAGIALGVVAALAMLGTWRFLVSTSIRGV